MKQGYRVLKGVFSYSEIESILREFGAASLDEGRGGIRNAEKVFPVVSNLAAHEKVFGLVSGLLAGDVKLVRAIYFDKEPGNNWLVSWHQDRTVALSTRFESEGWGPWTLKDGTIHVQPPIEVLNSMVTVRIHLDDTTRENGCLNVIPNSHELGLLNTGEIHSCASSRDVVPLEVSAGDVVLMRPHILHSSSKSLNLRPRRVVHLEFSDYELPKGVIWG
jgi:ectoine hydroxylase-related dioxygenase (phytanoyl-CoA dioxygenase family)